MKKFIVTYLIILLGLQVTIVCAQSLPVGTVAIEDFYRREQLLGAVDPSISFMVRPTYPRIALMAKNVFYKDSIQQEPNSLNINSRYFSKNRKIEVDLLPFSIQTQINSSHPYGWNDGPMIPNKGLQAIISAGLYLDYGMLSIQLRPEIVMATNHKFDTFNKDQFEVLTARYYDYYNNIDNPARFGNDVYSKAYWGQSSIRLNYESLSFGLSTENLWWGPGIRNSLLMSNNAPGFKHITLNTRKPISTAIGSFEGQIIAGKLEGSGFGVLEPEKTFLGDTLYVPKLKDWRYLSGITVTWQPKWIPGLFFGFTSSAQIYHKDLSGFTDYLPFYSATTSITTDQPLEKRDTRSSLYMRWIWPEENAEIYFEYGKNNALGTKRNKALEGSKNRAYIFGLRKIIPFNSSKQENLMISIEATQLQETSPTDIYNASSWYVNKYIRHGYTNRGEVLGAGIGPGANSQTLDVSWIKGFKKVGVQFERYVHNNDLYIYSYTNNQDSRRHWTDLSIGFNGEWNYKNLILNAKLMGVKSLNYQWYLYQGPTDDINVSGKDAFNLQLQTGLSYRF